MKNNPRPKKIIKVCPQTTIYVKSLNINWSIFAKKYNIPPVMSIAVLLSSGRVVLRERDLILKGNREKYFTT